jgi:transcriptional regulator with XRE-family HTH domain
VRPSRREPATVPAHLAVLVGRTGEPSSTRRATSSPETTAVSPVGDPSDVPAPARFGARLRAVRRQQHLSLHDVEVASNLEFKASVLGAYERGERAISVPRLQRLARLYRVPVAEMVEHDERAAPSQRDRPVAIDLVALRRLQGRDAALLDRYLRAIEVERGDYNGRVLTIRRSDAIALASILQCLPDQVPARLHDLGVWLTH